MSASPPPARPDEPPRDGCLRDIIPFSYLPDDRRSDVESKLRFHVYDFRAGCSDDGGNVGNDNGGVRGRSCEDRRSEDEYRMYVCISGGFVYADAATGRTAADDLLLPGSYFGERAAIFRTPHTDDVRSYPGRHCSSAWSLGSADLIPLLRQHNPGFALAVASNLRHTQGIFDAFLAFQTFAFSAFHEPDDRPLDMGGLLERYRNLKSALHPHVNDEHVVDYGAWSYALRRLPRNITRSYNIVCSRRIINVLGVSNNNNGNNSEGEAQQSSSSSLPPIAQRSLRSSSKKDNLEDTLTGPGASVPTDARRRTSWEVMPGKLFILLRELLSDYLDVITCLCIHSIETTKLWRKLRPIPVVAQELTAGLEAVRQIEADEASSDKETEAETERITDQVLARICRGRLDERDLEGLKKLWPRKETLQRLLDTVIHHADYTVFLDKRGSSHAGSADEKWSRRVRELAVDLVGDFDNVSGTDLTVDVVSSNTHSVLNCVCPYIQSHRDAILAWGRENMPSLFDTDKGLDEDMDRLYPAARGYFKARPEEAEKAKAARREAGIEEMVEREFTGISVQLFDLNKLKSAGRGFDELIPGVANITDDDDDDKSGRRRTRHLLINIDYCFGSQGENLLRLLLLTFGRLVRSVNVIGKAGGLASECKRGDILFPTHVLDEHQAGEMRTVDNADVSPAELSRLSRRPVHVGPVITVLGTVLQSTELLLFYERLWHATGMEMEASWYMRAVDEAQDLGLLSEEEEGLRSRFLYYVSDTPLDPSSSLATAMSLAEGVAPLYAVTRMVLSKVLVRPDEADEGERAVQFAVGQEEPTRPNNHLMKAAVTFRDGTSAPGGLLRQRTSRRMVRESIMMS